MLTPDILSHIVALVPPFGALNGFLRTSRLFASTTIDREAYITTTLVENEHERITINAYPNGYRLSASIVVGCNSSVDVEATYKNNALETFLHTKHGVMGHVAGAWWLACTTESGHRFQVSDGGRRACSVYVDVISGRRRYTGPRANDDAIEATMSIILEHARAGRRADACIAMAKRFGRDDNIANMIAGLPAELQ